MKLVKQTLLNASYWCFLLGLAFMWNPQTMQGCDGRITGFKLNKQDGSALVNLTNGAIFCESSFPHDIRIRTTESGTHQSLKYTISGPGGTWTNTENVVTYDSKQFWPTPGTWTIKAELYSHDNLGGTKCDTETISFTVTGNGTPTDGGAFSPRATVKCDVDNFNQGAIQPSVGKCSDNSTPRYHWQVKPEASGSWTNISGATGASYNPPSQGIGSKWYRRGTSCGCSTTVKYTATVYDVHVYNPKAGTIAGNQSQCDGYDPSNITSTAGASDGKGNLTYRWQKRPAGGTWSNISGATGATYNPGHISVTTQYRRQAQYDSQCTGRVTSNVITKTVEDCGPNVDCPALNANIGDACNDGNANTTNDVVNGNCNCVGTPIGPTFDCPALGANIGDACNDGNPNTNNDVVQSNCTCAGTPVGGGTCNATYSVNGRIITVSNLTGAIKAVKIIDNQWNTLYSCDDWGTNPCGGSESYTVPSCGTYSVQIQTYADWSTQICNVFETFQVDTDCGGGGVDCPALNANIGDACNDGNANTTNDRVQANCSCAGTPVTPVYDCPALGANIGDACNDGNANTNNDVVTANCGCAGTPIGSTTCDATYRVEGNKIIIEGLDAAINTAKILTSAWATEAECSDWTSACNGMLMATVPNGSYFVQIQTYADWSTPLCDIFEEVTVSGGTGGCNNVTNGGTISGDETGCGSYNPGMITSSAAPSGGSGAIEYLWLSSTTGCPRYLNQAIDGANGATYNPGTISQTTYYVRCSRRAGCDVWTAGESNCVVKTVDNNCNAGECANRNATDTRISCGTGANFGFYAQNLVLNVSEGANYSISNGSFVEFNDGTARFTARATSNLDSWVRWDIDVTFSGRTSTAPTGSPKTGTCNFTPGNDYYYYTATQGTLTGRDKVAGAKLNVTRRGEAFQVGTGANIHEQGVFGASGWLAYTVTSQPNNTTYTLRNGVNMDINIRLDGSPTACNTGGGGPTFDCPALGANVGDACNDGDANTENDQVQADCSCAGTPTNVGGGACNLAITSGADFIQVSGVVGAYPTVGISDDFGNVVYQCHVFNGGCPTTVRVDGLAPGTYWVNARVVDTDWVTVLCEAAEDPVVGGGAKMSNGNNNFQVEGHNVETTNEVVDFTLYPNPANETMNVSLVGYEGKDVTIQMIDFSGKPVKSVSIDSVNDTKVAIPIESVSNGIYTVRILSNGIKPVGKKMIVNKRF